MKINSSVGNIQEMRQYYKWLFPIPYALLFYVQPMSARLMEIQEKSHAQTAQQWLDFDRTCMHISLLQLACSSLQDPL